MSTVADNHISASCTLTHVLLNNSMRHNDQASIHPSTRKKKKDFKQIKGHIKSNSWYLVKVRYNTSYKTIKGYLQMNKE